MGGRYFAMVLAVLPVIVNAIMRAASSLAAARTAEDARASLCQ